MKRLSVLSVALLFIACKKEATPQLTSDAQLSFHSSYEIEQTTYNPCTNENMFLTGTVHSEEHILYQGTGVKLAFASNTNLTGTGLTSGKSYVCAFHSTDFLKTDVASDVTSNDNITNRLNFTTAGGNMLTGTAFYHLTRNASGEIIIDRARFVFDCK